MLVRKSRKLIKFTPHDPANMESAYTKFVDLVRLQAAPNAWHNDGLADHVLGALSVLYDRHIHVWSLLDDSTAGFQYDIGNPDPKIP